MADTWFVAKEWKARLVEFAGRRMLRNVANGETTTYDVSRSEGQVSQEGDAFNTKNMNDLEQRVANGFASAKTAVDTLSRDLTRVNVYVGGDGKLHFVNSGGADSVLPFSPDASAKIDKFISDSKYIDFFDSKTQNVSVVDGAQYLICDIGQYSSKIKFNSGCIINKTYTIPGNKQPDRVPSEYIITANSSTISVSGSSGAFFIRLK